MIAAGLRPSIGLAFAAALAAACAPADHGGGDRFVPFAEIEGVLQPELQNDMPPAALPSGTLRVVTYNVHFADELTALIAAFSDVPSLTAADLVFLQEVDAHPSEGATRAAKLANSIGMNHAYAPAWAYSDGGTHGLAVLSRFPITSAGVLDLPYYDLRVNSERRIALRATIQVGEQELAVVVVHLDTRINVNDRLNQLAPAARLADASCILGGDFNTLPFVLPGASSPCCRRTRSRPSTCRRRSTSSWRATASAPRPRRAARRPTTRASSASSSTRSTSAATGPRAPGSSGR